MNHLSVLYATLSAVSLPAAVIWALFPVAGLAFAWGVSGAVTSFTEHRRPRPVPVIILMPGYGEWLAYAPTRDMPAVTS